jgi:hypothetical protein
VGSFLRKKWGSGEPERHFSTENQCKEAKKTPARSAVRKFGLHRSGKKIAVKTVTTK